MGGQSITLGIQSIYNSVRRYGTKWYPMEPGGFLVPHFHRAVPGGGNELALLVRMPQHGDARLLVRLPSQGKIDLGFS